ncbi:unnamed protein product [Zymoseptoria tritici ST99CH_1E4]|uniref:Uncharacterized protein n=1 Tax=Zymoseptoria tritici ST99CH_1E4 TaxID=1276532 RepID=A0A2H1FNE7_ZYMTR|nr:unnamed protein product [Zymoseptoria tritici ST99CH_1E4]
MAIREPSRSVPQPQQHPQPPHSHHHGHTRHPSLGGSNGVDRMPTDIWTSAISRLQAQVSYNTGMLESHRRQFADMEMAVNRLNQELGSVAGTLNEVRNEVRSRQLGPSDRSRHDSGDLEIISGQLQRLTNRVNEVDGLNMQMDLIKNRLKRMEDHTALSTPQLSNGRRPPTSSSHPEGSFHEPAQQQQQQPHSARMPSHQSPHVQSHPHKHHPLSSQSHHLNHPVSHPPPHAPLPPMRIAGPAASPDMGRPPSFPARPTLESQRFRQSSDSTPFVKGEQSSSHPASSVPLRSAEPLPPASTLSGWRPAESLPPSGLPHSTGPERHNSHSSGWAAVNANPATKRSADDRPSPYQSPMLDGSKRPKLAPLMPNMSRSGHSDDSQTYPAATTSAPFDGILNPRSRAPSDGSHAHSQPSASQHNFRFITSTQPTDGADSWRAEAGGPTQSRSPQAGGRGRSKGRRGGRGSRSGRGGAAASPHTEGQEQVAPQEWDKHEWSGGPAAPNGYHYNPPGPYSPDSAARAAAARRPDAMHIAGPLERHIDFPATPSQLGSPQDQFTNNIDGGTGGSGKKTRTKPIRNAEGVLIRKDGRPDMRSVSSANNLRKVHAKKEAERAGWEEGMEEDNDGRSRSPRTGTPASGVRDGDDASPYEEPVDHATHHQDRHRELMSRIFEPHGQVDNVERVAGQFFPKQQQEGEERFAEEKPMKDQREVEGERSEERREEVVDEEVKGSAEEVEQKESSVPAVPDVVMRGVDDTQPAKLPPAQKGQDEGAARAEEMEAVGEEIRVASAIAGQAA